MVVIVHMNDLSFFHSNPLLSSCSLFHSVIRSVFHSVFYQYPIMNGVYVYDNVVLFEFGARNFIDK